MSKGKNHTDRVFRDSLREYQAAPPEGVWSGIADTLESGRKKSRNSLMAGIAAAAAVIIAAGSIWVLTRRNPEIQMVRTETTEATTTSQESQALEAEPAIPDPDDLKDTGPGPEQEIRTDEVPVREQDNLAEDGPAVNSEYLTDVSYGQEQAVQPESRELQPGGTNAGQLGLDRGQTPEALFPGSGQSEFVV